MIPGTVTTHEILLAAAWHIRERSEGRVVGEPEELIEESNIVLLRDNLRGARRIAATVLSRYRAKHYITTSLRNDANEMIAMIKRVLWPSAF